MTPQEAAAALSAHQISYDDYRAAIDAYNRVDGAAPSDAAPAEPSGNVPTPAPTEGEGFTPPVLAEPAGLTPNAADRRAISRGDAANAKLEGEAAEERDLRRRQTLATRAAGTSAFFGDPEPLPRDASSPPLPASQRTPAPAPPGRGGPNAGASPIDAALAGYVRPGIGGGAGPARAVGLGPSDRAAIDSMREQGQAINDNVSGALAQNRQIADDFAQQTQTLADDSRIGALTFAQSQKEDAARRAELQSRTDEAQRKVDAHIADLQGQGIDPNHYWANQSTGQRIGAAIAIGFGALGASFNHGPNTALDMINGAIERDIDAQKANLSKGLELAKMAGQSANTRFDHEKAMLDAQRESTQVAYATASADITKRAAMFAGNADVQTKAAQLQAQLSDSATQRIGALNERIYAIQKSGERVVGGGGSVDLSGKVIKRAQELSDKAHAEGRELNPSDARRLAAEEYGLVPPGASGNPALAKAEGGAGSGGGKERENVLAHQGAIANIDRMLALREKHGGGAVSPDDRAQAVALAARTQEQLVAALGKTNQGLLDRTSHLIPDQPLELRASGLVGADEIGTSLRTARSMLSAELERMAANPASANEHRADPGEEEDDK